MSKISQSPALLLSQFPWVSPPTKCSPFPLKTMPQARSSPELPGGIWSQPSVRCLEVSNACHRLFLEEHQEYIHTYIYIYTLYTYTIYIYIYSIENHRKSQLQNHQPASFLESIDLTTTGVECNSDDIITSLVRVTWGDHFVWVPDCPDLVAIDSNGGEHVHVGSDLCVLRGLARWILPAPLEYPCGVECCHPCICSTLAILTGIAAIETTAWNLLHVALGIPCQDDQIVAGGVCYSFGVGSFRQGATLIHRLDTLAVCRC